MVKYCSLNRRPDRGLGRRLGYCLTRRLDGRPYRLPNHLAQACDRLERYLRLRHKAARDEPHLYGPHAERYRLETLQLEAREREADAALQAVYGPEPPDAPPHRFLWQERYEIPTSQMPVFRKWFRENYGP
jgi:hypothetical protein